MSDTYLKVHQYVEADDRAYEVAVRMLETGQPLHYVIKYLREQYLANWIYHDDNDAHVAIRRNRRAKFRQGLNPNH